MNEGFFEELEGEKDANFESMAFRMLDALKKERALMKIRLNELDAILDG